MLLRRLQHCNTNLANNAWLTHRGGDSRHRPPVTPGRYNGSIKAALSRGSYVFLPSPYWSESGSGVFAAWNFRPATGSSCGLSGTIKNSMEVFKTQNNRPDGYDCNQTCVLRFVQHYKITGTFTKAGELLKKFGSNWDCRIDCYTGFAFIVSPTIWNEFVFQATHERFLFVLFRNLNDAEQEYSFETVRNIDPAGCEWSPTVRQGMRNWNMSVQWWLANFIYKRWPNNLKKFK